MDENYDNDIEDTDTDEVSIDPVFMDNDTAYVPKAKRSKGLDWQRIELVREQMRLRKELAADYFDDFDDDFIDSAGH